MEAKRALPVAASTLMLLFYPTASMAAAEEPAADDQLVREFGVMANSNDMRRIPVANVASLMKEIGYRSVAVSCQPAQFVARVRTYRDAGIRVGAVYVGWTTDGQSASLDIPLETVLGQLRNTGAVIMLHLHAKKGSMVTDRRIVEQLKPLARQAKQAGVTIAVYPHVGFQVATLEHATRIADAVDHPAFGVCFNLCHYLKQNDEKDLPAKLQAAKDRIRLVTINGAATGNTRAMSWDRLIQQLNHGDYDLARLLDLLCGELDFKGPIFVQCYNLKAPARRILQETYARWQNLKRHCVAVDRASKGD